MTPQSFEVADQVRELGLQLGDMIEGWEGAHGARLVLKFLGTEAAVFDEWVRVDDGTWRYLGESAEWNLSCRDWIRIARSPRAHPIQLDAQIDTLLTHPDWIARLRDLLAGLPATEADAMRRERDLARDTLTRAGWEYIPDAIGGPIWKPPVNVRMAELRSERDELRTQVHIITSERDELADCVQSLRAKHAELAARLAGIERAKPVAWIEHELQGTGLRHLHFERRPNRLRDDVVAPIWTELIARPAPAAAPDHCEDAREMVCATSGLLGATSGVGRECDYWAGGVCTSPEPCQHQQPVKPCRCGPDGRGARVSVRVRRELFRFESQQQWINKAKSWYANCGVRQGIYMAVDNQGHVMHMGKCFSTATERSLYPVVVYELQTNWPDGDNESTCLQRGAR